jgi:histidinol-phosphate/aromatic aminotransferase/cobyric acid decarboxylase-like protein
MINGLVGRLVLPVPSFNEYEAGIPPERLHRFSLRESAFRLDVAALVDRARRVGADTVVVVNPNNPTSLATDRDDLSELLEALADLPLVVVDESFVDFAEDPGSLTLEPHLARFPNLLIVKSLGKAMGLPGLRLGYAASADTRRIAAIRRLLPIWNVNALAEWFLERLPRNRGAFTAACARVREDRAVLVRGLRDLGFDVLPPSANFAFARTPDGVASTWILERLLGRHRILVKDCSNKPGLEDARHLRIAVRNASDNALLLRALGEEMGELAAGGGRPLPA